MSSIQLLVCFEPFSPMGCSNLYFLTLAQQLILFLTAMVASIGAPGIPSAGMVTMAMVLQVLGLPLEALAILLPMDRLIDTFRTTINVEGDLVGALIVNKITKP